MNLAMSFGVETIEPAPKRMPLFQGNPFGTIVKAPINFSNQLIGVLNLILIGKNQLRMVISFFIDALIFYSTVTDFARLRGWSTLQPRITAIW